MSSELLDESGGKLLGESGGVLGDEGLTGTVGGASCVAPAATTSGAGAVSTSGTGACTAPAATASLFGRWKIGGSGACTGPAASMAASAGVTAAQWRFAVGERITLPAGLTAGDVAVLIDLATASGGTGAYLTDESGAALMDESGNVLGAPGAAAPDEVVPDGWTRLDGAPFIDASDASRLVVSARRLSPDLSETFVDGMGGDALKLLLIFDADANGINRWQFLQADPIQAGTGAPSATTIRRSTSEAPMVGVAVKAVRAASGALSPTLDTSPAGGFDQPPGAYRVTDYSGPSMAIEANHLIDLTGTPADAAVASADDGATQFFTAFLLDLVPGSTGTGACVAPGATVTTLAGVNIIARVVSCTIRQEYGVSDLTGGNLAEIAGDPSVAAAASGDRVAEITAGPSSVTLSDAENGADLAAAGNEVELQE